MNYDWVKIPLFEEWDYKMNIVLENSSFILRLYYSDRTQKWSIDVSSEDGDDYILGETILPYKPTMVGSIEGLSGGFWLEPISFDENETQINPSLLFKYYNLYYIY